jgi:tetratricopeptide (TPR) repeat protein
MSAADLKGMSAAVPANSEYGTQILYEERSYRFAADGTLSYVYRLIFRVDSADAVQGWAEASTTYDPWYEKQAQIRARVLQADGRFVELDPKTVTDAPVKGDDEETFSSSHERRAPLPGMAVGAIVEEEDTVEEKIPSFAKGGLYRVRFSENVPVERQRVVVELPSSTPFKDSIRLLPGLAVERSEADGRRRVVYEATKLAAHHDADIDLATNEPVRPMVEFATGASWAAIVAGYAEMSEKQASSTEVAAVLPKDLPAERAARIRAIVKQLHHEVRYTGVEFGAARLTPQMPAEVLKRHYGDCKDKATLLVAMLRAAGIKADLALLDTGVGQDVDPGLPGISQFDHAIVYVPAGAAGEAALWIDATAEYSEVGSLPYEDEGRRALVIAAETTGLTLTPEPKPEDSVLIETRTFKLSEYGPAAVEEASETHGFIDSTYRSLYGGPETPKIHEQMETYAKNTYLAKKLVRYEHGDSADFDHPFHLTLEAAQALRGNTSMLDAVVVVFPVTTAQSLPKWFFQQPPGPNLSELEKHELAVGEQSRPASFAVRPYVYEMRVRVLVPPGFQLRALPADKTTPLGPATLTESYSAKEPGVVNATFRFNSGPSKLTAEQALAMRTAALELGKRDYVGLFFDQMGAKEMTAGHVRAALEIDRKLIADAPTDAMHHLQLARVLLDAKIGEEAHAEARRGTELAPKLAAGYETLGWTLEHDALGERFGTGYDRAGAIAAFQKAIALDPDDNDPQFDMAVLYEFDRNGERYAQDADLPAAIKSYKALIELNKAKGDQAVAQYRENMLYALLYARQFSELDAMIASLASSNGHRSLAIASAAAQHGAAAGIAQADKGNTASTDRNQNLRTAATMLANLHLYSEAADVMSAGIQGGGDAAAGARQIELYRGLKTASLKPLPASDPAAVIHEAYIGMLGGTLTLDEMMHMVSEHAYTSRASMERDTKKGLASVGFMRRVAAKSDMTPSVLLDLIAGNTTFTAKGDDEKGWDVVALTPGSEPDHTFVVKENGAYRMVGDKKDVVPVGNEVMWALEHGKPAEAKTLLDWMRDLTKKQGSEDPFEGPLLPRFWTIGSTKPGADSPAAMRLSAFALLAGSMDAKPYLAEIAAAREKASGQRQTDLDLLLAVAAMDAEDPDAGMPAAKRLLEQEPDSVIALGLVGKGYALRNDTAGWQAMLAPMLAKKPTDKDLLTAQVGAYELAHDFATAQKVQQKVLDSGKATANDYNSYAWLGLFHQDLGEDITKAAQQSAEMGKNSGFAELHTLACVYAAQGRTSEAWQVLQQAMYAGNMGEPNSAVWYALGLIYEQYGAKSAALDAYKRVEAHEFDDHTYINATATYVLAQDRIKALQM